MQYSCAHHRLPSLATHHNSSPQLQCVLYSPPSPQECRILGNAQLYCIRNCHRYCRGGGNTSRLFGYNLGTEYLIDTVFSPNDSQEVALSIYTRNGLISVAIEKEKEMSQSLLTCPSITCSLWFLIKSRIKIITPIRAHVFFPMFENSPKIESVSYTHLTLPTIYSV